MRSIWRCAALPLAMLMTACTVPIPLPQKVPLASEEADQAGKRFVPAEGAANTYISRTSIIGSRYRFGILLDGKPAGVVALNTHLLLQVPPGEHRLSATSPENVDVFPLNAVAGRNYFFEVSSRTGTSYANAVLTPLKEADGKAAVLRTRRAAPWD